jgi:hypothetical protein
MTIEGGSVKIEELERYSAAWDKHNIEGVMKFMIEKLL